MDKRILFDEVDSQSYSGGLSLSALPLMSASIDWGKPNE